MYSQILRFIAVHQVLTVNCRCVYQLTWHKHEDWVDHEGPVSVWVVVFDPESVHQIEWQHAHSNNVYYQGQHHHGLYNSEPGYNVTDCVMKIKIISITKFNSCTTLLKYIDTEYIQFTCTHEFFEGHLLINESNGLLFNFTCSSWNTNSMHKRTCGFTPISRCPFKIINNLTWHDVVPNFFKKRGMYPPAAYVWSHHGVPGLHPSRQTNVPHPDIGQGTVDSAPWFVPKGGGESNED